MSSQDHGQGPCKRMRRLSPPGVQHVRVAREFYNVLTSPPPGTLHGPHLPKPSRQWPAPEVDLTAARAAHGSQPLTALAGDQTAVDPMDALVSLMSHVAVDWNGALEQSCGDVDFMRELLGELHVEVLSLVEQLRTVVRALPSATTPVAWRKSVASLKMIAHSLKGSCANLCCKQISSLARALELDVRNALESADVPPAVFIAKMESRVVGMDQCFVLFSRSLQSKGVVGGPEV